MDAVKLRERLEALQNQIEDILYDLEQTPAAEPEPVERKLCYGKQVSPEFKASVLWIEEQLKLDANKLMACMKFESDLNPRAKNPQSSATGLIQFMDATVASMVKKYPVLAKQGITKARDLTELTAQQQLAWVYYYFKAFGNDLSNWSIEDVYMAILLPSMIGKPLDAPMKWSESAYRVNSGLDLNKDKTITKREAAFKVTQHYAMGMTEEFLG